MSDHSSTATTEHFSFLEYVKADLLRARELLSGPSTNASVLRLWSGALAPRFVPVLLCRTSYSLYLMKMVTAAKVVSTLNFLLFGIEIAVRCPIGKGLFLPHTQGTVIGAWSIGDNVTIFQGVTLGAREVDFSYSQTSRPVIEDGVIIGSGAKVLGGIVVGAGAHIGANAVLLTSVRGRVVVAGVPARIVKELD